MIEQCVVLAGGLGTRISPIEPDRPKALVTVGGQPFLDWQLSWLAAHGMSLVILAVGHRANEIRTFAGTGSRWALRIEYVEEKGELLGTGGALRAAAESRSLGAVTAVLYGDSLLQVTLQAVAEQFLRQSRDGAMTVMRNKNRWDRSNVEVSEKGLVSRYTKDAPEEAGLEYIDYGLTILRKSAIIRELKMGQKADLALLYQAMAASGQLGAIHVTCRFYEVGSPRGWRELDALIRSGWKPG